MRDGFDLVDPRDGGCSSAVQIVSIRKIVKMGERVR